uniref:Uncharacterized protein n=1 Tax=Quercus lobata TaxID=97700 RepID=A0A7N2LYV8_QUELO
MRILWDPSLASYHLKVVGSLMFTFKLCISSGGKSLTSKMPRDRRRLSLCADFSALSMEQGIPEEKLGSVNDVKECEEARCPICMEHPHNAILFECTSHGKGCRTYICNTNYWHASYVIHLFHIPQGH